MKKDAMASIAPSTVRAEGGVIMAGGNVPVKGILIDGVVIENSSLVQGSTELIEGIMLSLLSSSEQTVFFVEDGRGRTRY